MILCCVVPLKSLFWRINRTYFHAFLGSKVVIFLIVFGFISHLVLPKSLWQYRFKLLKFILVVALVDWWIFVTSTKATRTSVKMVLFTAFSNAVEWNERVDSYAWHGTLFSTILTYQEHCVCVCWNLLCTFIDPEFLSLVNLHARMQLLLSALLKQVARTYLKVYFDLVNFQICLLVNVQYLFKGL